jgi:mono/diheme cytochrome c family protein/peroxiredoxin
MRSHGTMHRAALTFLASLLAGVAHAVAPDAPVNDFALLDQNGKFHHLYYLSDAKAVVLMAHDNECATTPSAIADLEQAKESFGDRGVEFLMINVDDSRESIAAQIEPTGTSIPVLVDEMQLVGESLRLQRAGEVLVIDPKGWKVAYRGPLARKTTGNTLLTNALEAVLAGKAVKSPKVAAKGCALQAGAKRELPGKKISYANQIAPLLADNCVTCHRTGGIGPFPMNSHALVQGFSPMIREVILTRRMPPWHADPHVGTFEGARSLTKEQAQTLVHWIEAGSPRGDGPDPLAATNKQWPEWVFGEPDLVVTLPAFDVPATGTIDYQRYTIANTTGRDVWIRASDTLPGDRSVVHHVLVGVYDPKLPERERMVRATSGELGAYVPGNGPVMYPEGTGVLVPKDCSFAFQMHYTSSGKASRDETRVGFYFAKEPPKYEFKTAVLFKPTIKIPANTKAYTDSTTYDFAREAILYSFTPHAHYRGSASNFVARYPDGREELLLSVPKYDFNWQTTYSLKTPKVIPAGTRIVHSTTYDNSSQNPANPDPNRIVPWGEQSWDEMLYGVVRYRETSPLGTATAVSKVAANE